MKNILEITKANYLPPHTCMGRTLQECCNFEAVDTEGKVSGFSAYGEHARKLMRKIVSKKKIVCFCSFYTFSTPLKNKKGVITLDHSGNQVLTTKVRYTVKRVLDYSPKATYYGTKPPFWISPFLFSYPKVQRGKRVNKRKWEAFTHSESNN